MHLRRAFWFLWLAAALALYFFENNAGTRALLAASVLLSACGGEKTTPEEKLPRVRISELMGKNRSTLALPDGSFPAWLELEKQFRPHISVEGIPYLEKGTRWQYQMHIYECPFYYIDYCLAQTAAFQFLLASRENYADAFARYLRLSKQGGEKVWTELLTEAGFPSPFEPGALKELAEKVEKLLDSIRV